MELVYITLSTRLHQSEITGNGLFAATTWSTVGTGSLMRLMLILAWLFFQTDTNSWHDRSLWLQSKSLWNICYTSHWAAAGLAWYMGYNTISVSLSSLWYQSLIISSSSFDNIALFYRPYTLNTQADKTIDHQQASYQKLWTSPLVQDQHPSFYATAAWIACM